MFILEAELSMHGNCFYAHTPKCGGTSVRLALADSRIFLVQTEDITLTEEFFESLFRVQLDRPLIIHGHIQHLGRKQKELDPIIYRKFLRQLYTQIPLIFPTRHPAELVQSWMHYSKTRVNQFLLDQKSAAKSKVRIFGSVGGMARRVAHLKQNTVKIVNDMITFQGYNINLLEENEEENMHLFIDYLLDTKNGDHYMLRSMQFQLMGPLTSTLQNKIVKGLPYSVVPPHSDATRPIFYYDSQNINDKVARILDQYTFQGYSNQLRLKRANSSTNRPSLLASSIKSVDERLMSIIPDEYRIHQMSLAV